MLSELLSPKEAPSPVRHSTPHLSPSKIEAPSPVSADSVTTAAATSTAPADTTVAPVGADEALSKAGSLLEEMKTAVGSLSAQGSEAVVLSKPVVQVVGAAVVGLVVALLGAQASQNRASEVCVGPACCTIAASSWG
jgi:hypothetical protein